MAETSAIEWTDATWNIVTGCSVVSPGCTNCYAMKLAGRRLKHHPSRAGLTRASKAGPVWTGEVRVNWEWITQPLQWQRPRTIFTSAHGDLFHKGVEWVEIAQIYGVMIAAHHLRGHRLQVLTKRSDRARKLLNRDDFWELANSHAEAEVMSRVDPLDRRSGDARATLDDYGPHAPPPGIWLGASVEDQARADERIPELLATPAAVRFLSCEPLLGPVNLNHVKFVDRETQGGGWEMGWESALNGERFDEWNEPPVSFGHAKLDWVICGGESGPDARPMHPDWARDLRDQCDAAGVPFFFKQWGEWAPGENASGPATRTERVASWWDGQWDYSSLTPRMSEETHVDDATDVFRFGKKAAGRLLDGVEHNGIPEVAHV